MAVRPISTLLVAVILGSMIPASVQSSWMIDREEKAVNAKQRNTSASSAEQRALDERANTLQKASQAAITAFQKQIKKHWSHVETTSQSSWVTYSEDFKTKRVVDYAANEIRISFERPSNGGRIDFIRTNEKVRKELVKILGTDIRTAYEEDPVSIEIHRSLKDPRELMAQMSDELVLSELFEKANPSKSEIDRRARQLLKGSIISYQQNMAANFASLPIKISKKLTYKVPMPENRLLKKAAQYKGYVYRYAKESNVAPDLLFAIIHTESHFNPLARSRIPAYGLMQIVPRSAGRDASKLLFEKAKLLSPSYLYNPDKNIQIGAAYINVLYYRYMSKIDDPTSRLYCTIAAYNGGSANVAKAFTSVSQMSKAVHKINELTPEQVLERLKNYLPSKETRDYVKKVIARQKLYRNV